MYCRFYHSLYFFLVIVLIVICGYDCSVSGQGISVKVDVRENIENLLREEDTDGDDKITVNDLCEKTKPNGDGRFFLESIDHKRFEIVGTYFLSNLLQELWLDKQIGSDTAKIQSDKIFENPVHRISRMIRNFYWEGLTRRIDREHIDQVLADEKVKSDSVLYLYVPYSDSLAWHYYSDMAKHHPGKPFTVVRLPEKITPEYVKGLEGKHGLLSLALDVNANGEPVPLPYVVPGGRFNEMYGWDSYFIVLGLIQDNRIELARDIVDHFVYEVRYYGKILNANRTYYLTRSQPPFLTSMALAVYDQLSENEGTKQWLKNVFQAAIQEYRHVWMGPDRLTWTGLSRYFGSGIGPPVEVEPGHFDVIYQPFADQMGFNVREFERRFRRGLIQIPELDTFFVNDRSVRESGHDTTYRWDLNGNRCADFVTVDLNALLYKIEIDIGTTIREIFSDRFVRDDGTVEMSADWFERAEKRKKRILRYLWNEDSHLFFDYDFIHKKQHPYVSATALYPLWACDSQNPSTKILDSSQAEKLVSSALKSLEMAGGVAASAKASRGRLSEDRPQRQWDYPYGWAPHQMLIWQGLIQYGLDSTAYRLIYKWLYTILRNAVDYNGMIPEKFDVVKRSHEVFAEYGNVGTKFDYITKEGFGWMNASYQVGLDLFPNAYKIYLEQLIPPEWIFESSRE